MTKEQMKNKEEFLMLLRKYVNRVGLEAFIEWLEGTDFFTAPASTNYHSNYAGGLCEHSLLVYRRMDELNNFYNFLEPFDSIAICGLLHDVCKVAFYKQGTRNVKDENGNWRSKSVWTVDDQYPLGHGEKSCLLIQRYMSLTMDELYAIRWHMGGYDSAVKGGDWSGSRASEQTNLVTLLQVSDMIATSFFERRIEE